MLVLSRKCGEVIRIGEDIELRVLQLRGDQIVLGITAPKEVPVHRKEIFLRIQKAAASGLTPASSSPECGQALTDPPAH